MSGKSKLTITGVILIVAVAAAAAFVFLGGSTTRLLAQAREALEDADYEEARLLYLRVLHRDESNAEAALALSRVNRMLDRLEDAHTYADLYLRLQPGRVDGLVAKGEAGLASRAYSEASDYFSRALNMEPSNPQALAGLGSCQFEMGRATPMDQVLVPNPQDEARGELVRQARANLERALKAGAESHETRRRLVECLLETHDIDIALPLAVSLCREQPEAGLNHYLLGLCHLGLNQVDEAWTSMQTAFELARNDPSEAGKSRRLARVMEGNGIVSYRLGRLAEAHDFFVKASRNDPDRVDPYLHAAALLDLSGRRAEAFEHLNEAARRLVPANLPKTPENCQAPVTLYRLVNAAYRQGRHKMSIDLLMHMKALSPAFVQLTYEKACFEVFQGQEALACRTFEDVLAQEPNHADGNFDLGTILLRRGNAAEAIPCFERVIEKDAAAVDARINLAESLRRVGQFNEADRQYEAAMRMAPRNPEVLTSFGQSLELQGKFEEALAKYREVIGLFPRNAEARYRLGLFHLKRGEGREAVAELKEAVESNPEDLRLRIALADAWFVTGQKGEPANRLWAFQQATEILTGVREHAEGVFDSAASTGLGNLHLARGDIPNALDLFDHAIEVSTERRLQAYAYVNRAYAAFQADKGAEALQAAGEALRFAPDSVVAHYDLGCIYAARGNWTGALRYFDRAAALDVGHAPSAYNLALSQVHSGDLDKAVALLESNVENGLRAEASAIALGCVEARRGNSAAARSAFEKALSLAPRSDIAHANLSALLTFTGDNRDAASAAVRVSSSPADAAARESLALARQVQGILYAREGQWQDAQTALEEALELTTRSRTETLVNLGIACRSQGLFTSAERAYQMALVDRPRDTRILNALGDLYCHSGDYDKARDYFARSLAQDREQPRIREAAGTLESILKPL